MTAADGKLTVVNQNTAPLASGDTYPMQQDGQLTIAAPGPLGNDTDAEGDALTAVLVSEPQHGELTLNADGSFTYKPEAGFSGSDSFIYKANDGELDSGEATVTFNIAPVVKVNVSIPANLSAYRGTTVQVPVLIDNASGLLAADFQISYDTAIFDLADADIARGTLVPGGWGLTFQVNDAAGTALVTVYTGGAALSGGSGSLLDLAFHVRADAALGVSTLGLSGQLNEGALAMTAADGKLTVVNQNTAPLASGDTYPMQQDGQLTIAAPGPLGNDTDAEGDALTAVLVSEPQHGELTLNADGSFTYKPEAGFSGSDSFIYKANDGELDSGEATVTFNIAPVLKLSVSIPANLSAYRGTTVQVPVLIDNASGLLAADFQISYDTAIFDLADADIARGTLVPGGWGLTFQVNDAAGTALVTVYTGGAALSGGSGSLLDLAFHVRADAALGVSTLGLSGQLNEALWP